ncbi:MAG: type VII secretion protein EssC [Clostridium sp.]|nr:type VII secretion protein EssC [Clostridium sp.]
MDIKLLIYYGENLEEVILNKNNKRVTIGNRKKFKVYIKTQCEERIKITIKYAKGNWILKSLQLIGYEGKEVRTILENGKIFKFGFGNISIINIIPFCLDNVANVCTIPLKENIKLSIGRGNFNDILFESNKVSEKHAEIFQDKGKYVLVDSNSTNKTFLNKKMVSRSMLLENDVINICGYVIEFHGEYLLVYGASKAIKKDKGQESLVKYYPFVQKAPRIYPEIKKEDLKIVNPPDVPNKPSLYSLMTIIPSLAFFITTLAVSYGSKDSSSSPIFAVGMGASVLVYAGSYIGQKIVYTKKSKKRKSKYLAYMNENDKKLSKAEKHLRLVLINENPDLEESYKRVKESDIRLWERNYGDEDFLKIRVGLGNVDFPIKIKTENRNFFEEDPLYDEIDKLTDKYNLVDNVPISINIKNNNLTAIIGNRKKILEIVKNMITQISINHSPDEVKIVSVFDSRESKDWEWAKWLPHVWDDERKIRFMVKTKGESHKLLSYFYDVLSERKNKLDGNESYETYRFTPHFVFILGSKELIENEAIMKFLLNVEEDMEITTIFLSDKLGNLPRDCFNIIHVDEGEGISYNIQNSSEKTYFTPDRIDNRILMKYSRLMAPLRIKKDSFSNKLPKSISLFEELDINNPEEIDFSDIWSKSNSDKSLAVPIGIKESGEKFYLDLHQKMHGPHGLIAGTTGAGKSEILQTIIASLGVHFSPEYVNFLLIDYKGGSMSNIFKDMPHVVGIVTNLGGNQSYRAITAIDSEIKRREKILTSLGYNNIDEYQKNYKLLKHSEPLPHLIIIVDEFAQLKQNDPDFITQLVKVAVVGRSLGVHLILATQKPSGIVDPQIETNTNLKICLRVQDTEDSRAVIGKPDAASISNPGRAYIKVGHDIVYELIQSAFSGAKYKKNVAKRENPILMVNLNGTRVDIREKINETTAANETQLSKIIDSIKEYCKDNMDYELKLPWLPPLENKIYLEDIDEISNSEDRADLKVVIGMYDDPYNQCQNILGVDIEKENHIALYGSAGMGKTIFLQTVILELAGKNSPEYLNFYILDCGNGTLNLFGSLVHIGEVVLGSDMDRSKKLLNFIIKEIDSRKRLLSSTSTMSITDYNNKTGNKIPSVIFIIDNINVFISTYPDFLDKLVKIVRDGASLGVHVIYTAITSNSIMNKIKENITYSLAYNLNDKTEYNEIFGRMTSGVSPDKLEGRGLFKLEKVLEFQTALPVKSDEFGWSQKIREKIEEINSRNPHIKVKKLPVLKGILPLHEFLHGNDFLNYTLHGFNYNNMVPIGVNTDNLEGMHLNLLDVDHMVIAGSAGCGKTNFLTAFVMTLAETSKKENNKIYIVDSEDLGMFTLQKLECINAYIETEDQLIKNLKEIKDEISERKIMLRDLRMEFGGKAKNKIIDKKGNIFIVIDTISNFKDRFNEALSNEVEWIINNGKGMGIHVIIADDISQFTRAWEGIAKSIKSCETGIIFNNNIDSVFSNISPGLEYSKKILKQGEGFLIVNKKIVPIKIPTPFEGDMKFLDYINELNNKS